MTVDEVREKAERLVSAISKEFHLTDWEIVLFVEDSDPSMSGYQAIVEAYDEYEKAKITVYADNIDTDEELVGVMVHEMVHILISPVFRMAEINRSFGKLLHYAAERTTLRVERAMRTLGLHDALLALLEGEDEAEPDRDREQPEV